MDASMNQRDDAPSEVLALTGDLEEQLEQMKAAVKRFEGMRSLFDYADEINSAPRMIADPTISPRFALGGNSDATL